MRDDDNHTTDQYDDHMRRIAEIRHSFDREQITLSQKRRYIAEENMSYYRDENYRSTANGERLCKPARGHESEIIAIVADASGAPWEAARVAVDRRRQLCHASASAETSAEARELLAAAGDAFLQILTSAAPGGRHAKDPQ